MDKIVMPITGQKIKIAASDFPKIMTWEEANAACKALGKGWRLPTIDELEVIGKHLGEIGGFCNIDGLYFDKSEHQEYWSSTKKDSDSDWYAIADFDGKSMKFFRKDHFVENHNVCRVKARAVKTSR